jgi:hypothetical protein
VIPTDYTEPAPDWALDLFPRAPVMFVHTGSHVYEHAAVRMRVICSAAVYGDGKRWMHVSVSRPNALPDWNDLRLVKDTFIGRDRKAIQILPPASEYVNDHKYVLHLWACLDGDGLPDFRRNGTI